jgi:uncharacterized ion transporter superfamily protein YfcC
MIDWFTIINRYRVTGRYTFISFHFLIYIYSYLQKLDKDKEQARLELEMQRRRERIEMWRQEKKKKEVSFIFFVLSTVCSYLQLVFVYTIRIVGLFLLPFGFFFRSR